MNIWYTASVLIGRETLCVSRCVCVSFDLVYISNLAFNSKKRTWKNRIELAPTIIITQHLICLLNEWVNEWTEGVLTCLLRSLISPVLERTLSLSPSPTPLRMSTEMVSTEPVPPLELSEDILDKFDPHCSLSGKRSFGNACPISQERVLGHPAFRQVREKGPPETWSPVPSGGSLHQMDRQIAMCLWGPQCKY